MEIRDNENVCIITPLCKKIESYKLHKILEIIEKESRKVAIDLREVQECSIEFIEKIKNNRNKELGIFNIASDIFALFNIMNFDKSVKLFVSELDFEENSRQIINRKFTLL